MIDRLALLLLTLTLWVALPAQAQETNKEELAQLQTQLEQLSDGGKDSPRRQLLQQLITELQGLHQLQGQVTDLQAEIDRQPAEQKKLSKALTRAPESPPDPAQMGTEAIDRLITSLNARLLEIEREQALQQKQQTEALQNQQTIRDKLTGFKLQQELTVPAATTQELTDNADLRKRLQDISFEQHTTRVQALELELLALPRRAEISKLQWQLLEKERASSNELLNRLRDTKQARQRSEAERTLSKLREQRQTLDAPPLLANIHKENLLYSDQLRELLTAIEHSNQRRTALQERLSTLSSSFRTISQQLKLAVGHISPEQRRFIARNRDRADSLSTEKEINLQRLQKTLVEQRLTELSRQQVTPSLVATSSLSDLERSELEELLENQTTLVKSIIDARQQLITELNLIFSIQNEINHQIESNSQLLGEQLLWNPVSGPIDLQWPGEIIASAGLLRERWQQVWDTPLLTLQPGFYPRALLVVLLAVITLRLRRYLYRHQAEWVHQIGNVIHDRFNHSMQALVLPVLTAMLLPAGLLLVASSMINPQHPEASALNSILMVTAFTTWVVHCIRNWLKRPYGLFSGHFNMDETLARTLRQRLGLLYLCCLPLLITHIYLWNIDNSTLHSGLTRLVLFSMIAIIALLWASLWKHKQAINQLTEAEQWWLRAELWLSLLIIFNLAMLGVTFAGYTYSVNVMVYAVQQALLVLLMTIIFYKLGMRWLLIAERRLEFDRARLRRAEVLAAREKQEEEPPLETDFLNMQTISDHSRTLLKTTSWVILFAMLWGFLGSFLPFFGALDSIVLWTTTSAEGEIISSVSLKNLLFGFAILGLSLLAAYNLPGLLELLVLQNLNLTPGTGYALTSVIKYMLILVGAMGAFSNFGLEWNKLQWLVAALGVGLGFGLQEIFANFISGLIILFEKPVRIGDTVTIDNLTGTVTRIQIRATTIVDWDRKEVIIPNKAFITQQLINWSLSDSITRLVIPVGIAYGSDTERARALLLEAAEEESKVLIEPKPEAYFISFGDSSLNMSLRLHVNALADRLEVSHRIHTAIASKFRAAGIEIAFPQLDVHLYNSPAANPTPPGG